MMSALKALADRFWAVPMVFAVAASLLALGVTAVDESLDTSLRLPFLFAGGPEGARALLAAIITSMISFTALVFSITIVVLQLTSSQFSPRVLRSFLQDRFNQVALGVFVATFVYALVILRGVRGTVQAAPFVPQVGVTGAFTLVLISVLVFLTYIHHIAQSIRAASILASIADDTRVLLDERVPEDSRTEPNVLFPQGTRRSIAADGPGVVQWVDDGALMDAAQRQGVSIVMLRAVGEFVPGGAPLALVHGDAKFDDSTLRAAVHLGRERSMDQDVGFGLRQLVDIAERALSPGVNDPTTAVQAIDHLHDIVQPAGHPRPPAAATRRGRRAGSPVGPAAAVLRLPGPRLRRDHAMGRGQPPHPTSGARRTPGPRGRRATRTPTGGARGHHAPSRAKSVSTGRLALAVRRRTALSWSRTDRGVGKTGSQL